MGLDILRDLCIQRSLEERRRSHAEGSSDSPTLRTKSRPPSMNTVQKYLNEYDHLLQSVHKVDFNIHRFLKDVGRKNGLSVITVNILNKLYILPNPHIDETVLGYFLAQIYKGYRREVEYHNDIHAADVLQMLYIMFTQGGLTDIAQLNELDILSAVIASVCHDYDHDGLNNAYHVNAISDRAIRYSDRAVQESYHVAESFSILNKPEYNFLAKSSQDDFKTFRKRMIGIILATDMARHVADLAAFKNLMDAKQVKNGVNADKLVENDTPAKEFESKQQMLEIFVHAADVSTQTRPFDIAVEWTWLLFEEFFNQGDLEKMEGLPVSFLCDRTTTNIAKSQPGFLNFIVIPMFAMVSEVMPTMKELETNARENVKNYEQFKETEEQAKIYAPRTQEETRKRWAISGEKDLHDEEDCTTTPVQL